MLPGLKIETRVKKLLGLWGMLLLITTAAACSIQQDAAVEGTTGMATSRGQIGVELKTTISPAPSLTPTLNPPTATPGPRFTSTIPEGWRVTPSETIRFEFTQTSTALVTRQAGDHAVFVSQSPADGVVFDLNEPFLIRWSLRNDGTSYWDSNYKLVFAGGVPVTERDKIKSPDTKPGQTGEFYIWAAAPGEPGEYVTRWNLLNPTGEFMAVVFLKFTVSD